MPILRVFPTLSHQWLLSYYFSWRFHDAFVRGMSGYTVYQNGTMYIHEVKQEHEGIYQCGGRLNGGLEYYRSPEYTLTLAC